MLNKHDVIYAYRRVLFSYKKEVLINAKMRMNLENTMPGEGSQTQKPDTVSSHLFIMSGRGKSTDTENELVVARGWGREY